MSFYPPDSVLKTCFSIGVTGDDIYIHYDPRHPNRNTLVVGCLLPYSRTLAVIYQIAKHSTEVILTNVQRYGGEGIYTLIEMNDEVAYTLTFEVFV